MHAKAGSKETQNMLKLTYSVKSDVHIKLRCHLTLDFSAHVGLGNYRRLFLPLAVLSGFSFDDSSIDNALRLV
jgi:hypothetical protein